MFPTQEKVKFMAVSASTHQLEPQFLEGDNALEDLYRALHSSKPGRSLEQELSQLELLYEQGGEEIRYKILTEVIDMEYSGAIRLLLKVLKTDTSPLLRHEAAFGLGVLRRPANPSPLVDAMLTDPNLMVRHEAAIALAEVGNEEALEALSRAAQDERTEVAASARYAIQNIRLRQYRETE